MKNNFCACYTPCTCVLFIVTFDWRCLRNIDVPEVMTKFDVLSRTSIHDVKMLFFFLFLIRSSQFHFIFRTIWNNYFIVQEVWSCVLERHPRCPLPFVFYVKSLLGHSTVFEASSRDKNRFNILCYIISLGISRGICREKQKHQRWYTSRDRWRHAQEEERYLFQGKTDV